MLVPDHSEEIPDISDEDVIKIELIPAEAYLFLKNPLMVGFKDALKRCQDQGTVFKGICAAVIDPGKNMIPVIKEGRRKFMLFIHEIQFGFIR
jgi:hypothetical protein